MTDQAAVTPEAPTRPSLVPGGQVDDPNELRTDDFGLGGDLRKQLVDALEKKWNPEDPGATTLDDETDDSSADTAATPAPAPETSQPDASQGQAAQDGAGGGRAADEGGGAATQAPTDDTTPPAPTTAPTAEEEFDLKAYVRDYFGTDLTREQSQRLFGMLSRLQSLSPEEQAYLDQVLSGGQQGQFPATLGQPAQPQQQVVAPPYPGQTGHQADASPDPAVAVLGPRPDADEYAAQQWDLTARAVRAQSEQLSAIEQNIAATTRAQQEQQYQQAVARIDSAQSAWREQYKVLSDGEFDGLVARAAQTGTFPALIQAHHGDIEAATNALLEQQFWADKNLRERAIANIASGRQPGDATQLDPSSPVAQDAAAADAGRQALAGSVAGGGGSITPQTTAVPKDPEKKKQAMVQELASQHDFTP